MYKLVKTEEDMTCPTCGKAERKLFVIVESDDELAKMKEYGICAECMYELIEKHFSLIKMKLVTKEGENDGN